MILIKPAVFSLLPALNQSLWIKSNLGFALKQVFLRWSKELKIY